MAKDLRRFVDFNEIKQNVSMQSVLIHYGLLDTLTGPGDQKKGTNPFPGANRKPGKKPFAVNLQKNVWKLFGSDECGGNVLDFVMKMEGCDVRSSALHLSDWFMNNQPSKNGDSNQTSDEHQLDSASRETKQVEAEGNKGEKSNEHVNQPLGFHVLKNLDPQHESIAKLDVSVSVAEHFGIGFCSRGMMKGRIAIPIHSPDGVTLAYAGATIGKRREYKFPPKFQASLEIYNIHRATLSKRSKDEGFVLVPDFFDVFTLFERGYDNALALLGETLSEQQIERLKALHNPVGHFIIDGEWSSKAFEIAAGKLSRIAWVHTAEETLL